MDERLKRVMDAIDDPCDEGGFDIQCHDRQGRPCKFIGVRIAPEYGCIDGLRRDLAGEIIMTNDARRAQDKGP